MNWRNPEAELVLGSEIIELLIPHRRPFLLVDQIDALVFDPVPALRTRRHISANEPIFDGHFPDLHLWPGVYTIEGMGQTCNLLYVLLAMREAWETAGEDPAAGFDALRNLHRGYRMQPSFDPARSDLLHGALSLSPTVSVSAAVNVKLTTPIFAGQTICYEVALEHVVGDMGRFRVQATVDNRSVASGTMTSHRGPAALPSPNDA